MAVNSDALSRPRRRGWIRPAAEAGARCRFEPAHPGNVRPGARGFLRLVETGRPPFTRATVQAWRAALEAKGLAPASVNQKLSAVRKLAVEAAYNGLLDPAARRSAACAPGTGSPSARPRRCSRRPRLRPTRENGTARILAVLVGCGLRRDEAVRLTFAHIQQRDGRWCVVDLVGKKGRYRTVPMPAWTKIAIDSWAAAAGITAGPVFRGVNKGDVVIGERLSTQGILRAVARYAEAIAPHDLRRYAACGITGVPSPSSPSRAAPSSIRSSSRSATPRFKRPNGISGSSRI